MRHLRLEAPLSWNVRALPTARGAVTVRVPAKINLYLGVGLRRDDGFHELTTVFQAVSLYDDVTVTPAEALTVTVHGPGATDVPNDGTNLAARAAVALAAHAGIDPAVHIAIAKGIPVAGGMAGGSADAAAALVACDALWGTGVDRDRLHEIAAGLGSDVPFLLHGGTALGTGRGERLTPVLGRGRYHWVLALADGGLSTPAVYEQLDRQRERRGVPAPASDAGPVLTALRNAEPVGLGRVLGNDLHSAAVALRPALARTIDAGLELGAVGALVSGSGPTCAFLARDEPAAVKLAAALAGAGVARAVRRADGPVAGARVVVPAR